MAPGIHWEWRTFGDPPLSFATQFSTLERWFYSPLIEDIYAWAPGLQTNVKVRLGMESGVKLKRFLDKSGPLEKWQEDPQEFFGFPLPAQAWAALTAALAEAGRILEPLPGKAANLGQTIEALERSGCRMVTVRKTRDGRLWQGPNGRVLVEMAQIYSPQQISTVALESLASDLPDELAKADLEAAIAEFKLRHTGGLQVMNYLEAIAKWVDSETI